MFLAIILVSIFYIFPKNEIECWPIASENSAAGSQNADQIPTPGIEKPMGIQSLPSQDKLVNGNAIGSSRREPKFFGRLALIGGLGQGGLLTSASSNVNSFANIANGLASIKTNPLGYFSAYYEPFPHFPYPFSFPTWYNPFLDPIQLQFGFNQMSPGPENTHKIIILGEKEREDFKTIDEEENKSLEDDKTVAKMEDEDEDEDAAQRSEDSWDSVVNVIPQKPTRKDSEDYLEDDADQSALLRLDKANIVANQTIQKKNDTALAEGSAKNVTSNSTNPQNQTESPIFLGYYGGFPQNVNQIVLTTESSLRRYHDDNQHFFNLPFDRPADFRSYEKHQVDPNSHLYANSFSPDERAPEFFNTVDSDHYAYQNLNGFRPIL